MEDLQLPAAGSTGHYTEPQTVSNVQVSCSYGASLNPQMFINIYVSTGLLNMYYTAGYTPPPFVMADPNLFIPFGQQLTYVNNGGLNGLLSFPLLNNNTIEGAVMLGALCSTCQLLCAFLYAHLSASCFTQSIGPSPVLEALQPQ